MRAVLIKGTGLRSLLLAIERLHGERALRDVKEALPPDVRAAIEPFVLAARFYPVRVSAALQVAVRDTVGKGSWDVSHALGVEAAKIDLAGVYQMFLRATSYDTAWDAVERTWANYTSQGQARWYERRDGAAKGSITGVAGFNLGIWNSIAGRCEGQLRLAGARAASCELKRYSPTSADLEALWLR